VSLGYWTITAIRARELVTGKTINTAMRYALACAAEEATEEPLRLDYAGVEVDLEWTTA